MNLFDGRKNSSKINREFFFYYFSIVYIEIADHWNFDVIEW